MIYPVKTVIFELSPDSKVVSGTRRFMVQQGSLWTCAGSEMVVHVTPGFNEGNLTREDTQKIIDTLTTALAQLPPRFHFEDGDILRHALGGIYFVKGQRIYRDLNASSLTSYPVDEFTKIGVCT